MSIVKIGVYNRIFQIFFLPYVFLFLILPTLFSFVSLVFHILNFSISYFSPFLFFLFITVSYLSRFLLFRVSYFFPLRNSLIIPVFIPVSLMSIVILISESLQGITCQVRRTKSTLKTIIRIQSGSGTDGAMRYVASSRQSAPRILFGVGKFLEGSP